MIGEAFCNEMLFWMTYTLVIYELASSWVMAIDKSIAMFILLVVQPFLHQLWSENLQPMFLVKHRVFILFFFKEKLHFSTLNYILWYILHPKLFECTFCIINYDFCYTLHHNIKSGVNLDGKVWHYVKRPNYPFSQSIKNKWKITLYYPKLYFLLHFTS